MVSSGVVGSEYFPKYSGWPFSLSISFCYKSKMVECNVRHSRRFLFAMMYGHSKSEFWKVTWNFELEQISISSRHSNPNFCSLYWFSLPSVANFVVDGFLWWGLSCKLSIGTLKNDQWITNWWAKFKLECPLLKTIYSNSKFKVTCKKIWNLNSFECRYIRTLSEEKSSKIYNITFGILPFSL